MPDSGLSPPTLQGSTAESPLLAASQPWVPNIRKAYAQSSGLISFLATMSLPLPPLLPRDEIRRSDKLPTHVLLKNKYNILTIKKA